MTNCAARRWHRAPLPFDSLRAGSALRQLACAVSNFLALAELNSRTSGKTSGIPRSRHGVPTGLFIIFIWRRRPRDHSVKCINFFYSSYPPLSSSCFLSLCFGDSWEGGETRETNTRKEAMPCYWPNGIFERCIIKVAMSVMSSFIAGWAFLIIIWSVEEKIIAIFWRNTYILEKSVIFSNNILTFDVAGTRNDSNCISMNKLFFPSSMKNQIHFQLRNKKNFRLLQEK